MRGMAKFIRVGNTGINVEQINHYEVSDALGGGLGRSAAPTGQGVALVLFFGSGERLAITNAAEARQILDAIQEVSR
jgi:hypothetical protein